MATTKDIDTKAAVGKFLERRLVTPESDDAANSADEIQALLESTALTFLLFPRTALALILRAKNTLLQLISADLGVLGFMEKALDEVLNPDPPVRDTSNLVEAQSALLDLDRIGRVSNNLQAFGRYKEAIQRFLDSELAPVVKRRNKKVFERTGAEAQADLAQATASFSAVHAIVGERSGYLRDSVTDFRGTDLTSLVSRRTVERVRRSLRQVRQRMDQQRLSRSAAVVELLSGSAALDALSPSIDLYDPVVDTGSLPPRRTIELRPEQVSATVLSSEGPWDLTPTSWLFEMTVDSLGDSPSAISFELPASGADDSAYVTSNEEQAASTFDLPTNATLYVHVEGSASPDQEIPITSGSGVAFSTIVSDINAGLTDATCIEFNPGTNRFLIFGASAITSISVQGASSGSSGTYNTNPSVHEELGFVAGQTSLPKGRFTAESLADALKSRVSRASFSIEGSKLRITSNESDTRKSSIEFPSSGVQDTFGFEGLVEPKPAYVELVEDGSVATPSDLGVHPKSTVIAAEEAITGSSLRTLNNEPITSIDADGRIFFENVSIPRGSTLSVAVHAPAVLAVQQIINSLNRHKEETFLGEIDTLRRKMAPVLSRPTKAQVSDAKSEVASIKTRLETLQSSLGATSVPSTQTAGEVEANRVLTSLEERGLDRAMDLLLAGRFGDFFSLSNDSASRSGRLLKAMESVANEDIPTSQLEVDQEDDPPYADNPDDEVLPGTNSSDEDFLVGED